MAFAGTGDFVIPEKTNDKEFYEKADPYLDPLCCLFFFFFQAVDIDLGQGREGTGVIRFDEIL